MDDDVFNGLLYADDDNAWGEASEPATEQREPSGSILVSENNRYDVSAAFAIASASAAGDTSHPTSLTSLLFNDPVNWFNHISTESVQAAKKRKVEKQAEAVAIATRRIIQAKLKRKPIPDASSMKTGTPQESDLLKFPPLNNAEWLGICDPDNCNRRYVTLISQTTYKPKRKVELTRSKLVDVIKSPFTDKILKPYRTHHVQEDIQQSSVSGSNDKRLWVDKYAPRSFFDLITENYINRLTINWLNLWNEYIFNNPSIYEHLLPNEKWLLEIEDEKPFLPRKKVLILHGPPGCGKTSLAVAAARVKFSPFFINMNDIHNVADFNRILLHASSYCSISFENKRQRPRCIIIDGLEYASVEVANALVHWIKKRKKSNALRPIICTCNNLYSLPMRELRTVAVPLKISVDRVHFTDRIQEILIAENKILGNITVTNCIAQCKNDIRLCLNTLQFRCDGSKSQARISAGKKNDFTVFEVIDMIIDLNKHCNQRGGLNSYRERFEDVFNAVNQRSDMDRFVQIVFNNLFECVKPTTVQMLRVASLFVESDVHSSFAFSTQSYSILQYQTFALVGVHFALARSINHKIHIQLNIINVAQENRHILAQLDSIRTNVINMPKVQQLISDVLPMLMYIIQPPLQISGSIMYKNDGLESFNRIVELMSAFGLSLTMQAESEGGGYRFDPPIENFVIFQLHSRYNQLNLSTMAKQFIARQLNRNMSGHIHSSAPQTGDNSFAGVLNPTSFNCRAVKTKPFTFRYTSATAQAIKRNITTAAFFK